MATQTGHLYKLNIGCGTYPKKEAGWIHCDLYPSSTCDVIFDATQPWPFPDNSVGFIKCNHVLEHLVDYEGFFRAAYHALAPNAYLQVTVPYGTSTNGVSDVAHVRQWLPGSFTFLQPGYGEAVYNPQHRWAFPFAVDICLLRISPQMRRLVRWPLRRLGLKIIGHLVDAYNELTVMLRVLKTPEDVAEFELHQAANSIPVQRVMHRYEYEGKPYEGGPVDLVFLDAYQIGIIKLADVWEQLKEQQNAKYRQ